MQYDKYVKWSGLCPHSQKPQTIVVKLSSAPGAEGYKCMDFQCERFEEKGCPDTNKCPIYLSAHATY